MGKVELLMPEMGESVTDATISNWLVKEGDTIEIDQDVLEVSTDKVDTEVPSPVNGVIQKILHHEGEVVDVGKPLAIIEVEGESEVVDSPAVKNTSNDNTAEEESTTYEMPEPQTEVEAKHPNPPFIPEPKTDSRQTGSTTNTFLSPLVKNIAKTEGISEDELETIAGTGLDGRVTKDDILNYVSNRDKLQQQSVLNHKQTEQDGMKAMANQFAKQTKSMQSTSTSTPLKDGDEVVEMDKMRKLIADHMVNSNQTAPHVTLFLEVDVTNLVQWRNKTKQKFQEREGEKLTFTPLFIEAVTKAIKAFPAINASVVNQYKIHYKKAINIGMATALPNGNLIVPVIKNTGDKTISAIAKDVNDLANRARNNKLKPDDTQGGTFTITNIGTFDSLMGTPIINQPQSAILATGAIQKKPVVLETDTGDVIAIRQMMYLSLGMDHRIIDGALGGAFLQKVKHELENWDVNREV